MCVCLHCVFLKRRPHPAAVRSRAASRDGANGTHAIAPICIHTARARAHIEWTRPLAFVHTSSSLSSERNVIHEHNERVGGLRACTPKATPTHRRQCPIARLCDARVHSAASDNNVRSRIVQCRKFVMQSGRASLPSMRYTDLIRLPAECGCAHARAHDFKAIGGQRLECLWLGATRQQCKSAERETVNRQRARTPLAAYSRRVCSHARTHSHHLAPRA